MDWPLGFYNSRQSRMFPIRRKEINKENAVTILNHTNDEINYQKYLMEFVTSDQNDGPKLVDTTPANILLLDIIVYPGHTFVVNRIEENEYIIITSGQQSARYYRSDISNRLMIFQNDQQPFDYPPTLFGKLQRRWHKAMISRGKIIDVDQSTKK